MGKLFWTRYDYRESRPFISWADLETSDYHRGSFECRDRADYPLELQHPFLGLLSLKDSRYCESFIKNSGRLRTPGSLYELCRADPWWPRKRWPTWHAEHSPKNYKHIEWFDGVKPISSDVVKAEVRKGVEERFGVEVDGWVLRWMTTHLYAHHMQGVARLLRRERSIQRRIRDEFCDASPDGETDPFQRFFAAWVTISEKSRSGVPQLKAAYDRGYFEGLRVNLFDSA